MAKAASRRNTGASARIESTVVDYAEEVGRLLGTVRKRIDGMGLERRKIVQQLSTVVRDAQNLLTELRHEAATQVSRLTRATAAASAPRRKSAAPKRTGGRAGTKRRRVTKKRN